MKTKYKDGVMSFESEDNEKVYIVYATSFGDGDSFARFMTETEIQDEGWFVAEDWSKDLYQLEIGQRTTYNGFGGGHNFITRLN